MHPAIKNPRIYLPSLGKHKFNILIKTGRNSTHYDPNQLKLWLIGKPDLGHNPCCD